jgi:preprotein translocase subunit SecG
MLRIYARLLAAALVATAAAIAVRIPADGLSVGVLFYVGSAAVFAYAGFRRGEAAFLRSVVAVMGVVFLVSGLAVALTMGILGFPFGGKGWVFGLANAALQRSP